MSVRVTLNCQVKPNQFKAMQPFLAANLPNVRNFPGNIRVKVLYDESNNEMLLDEEWSSISTHQDYLSFITDNGVMAQLGSFLSSPPTIKYFNAVNI